jgi:hypothetical protein
MKKVSVDSLFLLIISIVVVWVVFMGVLFANTIGV